MNHPSWLALVATALLACGGSSSTAGSDGGGTADGPATMEGGAGDGGGGSDGSKAEGGDGAANDGSSTGDTGTIGDGAIPACTAASVNLTFANCPAQPTCGGTIVDGTYFYTAGCLNDPWAQAKQTCPALQVTKQQGTVKGCVSFTASVVARDVTSTYGATAVFPKACLAGQSCMQLQTLLMPYFQMVTCTPATGGSCSCDVGSTYSSQAAGAYTTSNNQIVTSAGNHYDYCVNGSNLGISYVSGPTPEPGNYTLTKQ